MKKIFVLLLGLSLLLCGCSILIDEDNSSTDTQVYDSANGYSLDIPADWTMGNETEDSVEFHDADNQISMTITTELGGIDYYALREIKEQLTENIAAELFTDYEIIDDNGGTKYFRRIIDAADKDGAHIIVDMYASQPYLTMRHYVIIIAAADAYEQYEDAINDMISSFTITKSEDEYLQLMEDRRAADKAAETESTQENNDTTEPTND